MNNLLLDLMQVEQDALAQKQAQDKGTLKQQQLRQVVLDSLNTSEDMIDDYIQNAGLAGIAINTALIDGGNAAKTLADSVRELLEVAISAPTLFENDYLPAFVEGIGNFHRGGKSKSDTQFNKVKTEINRIAEKDYDLKISFSAKAYEGNAFMEFDTETPVNIAYIDLAAKQAKADKKERENLNKKLEKLGIAPVEQLQKQKIVPTPDSAMGVAYLVQEYIAKCTNSALLDALQAEIDVQKEAIKSKAYAEIDTLIDEVKSETDTETHAA